MNSDFFQLLSTPSLAAETLSCCHVYASHVRFKVQYSGSTIRKQVHCRVYIATGTPTTLGYDHGAGSLRESC